MPSTGGGDVVTSVRSRVPAPVKRLGRAASRRFGQLTAPRRMLPAFLVVGAQRAGTTSLHRALVAHPQVVGPNLHKGVNYFDLGYANGLDWYRGHFPTRAVARRRAGGDPSAFESSGYYLHHPLAAERIAATLPEARVLVMLRDPVERAYSAHRHELARGFETVGFEEALDLEPRRLAGEVERIVADPSYVSESHRHHAYVGRGEYAAQLRRLYEHVPPERVHVVWSEDFFEQPEATYDAVLAFLGLAPFRPIGFERWNARPRSPMSDRTRRRLDEHFRPHDEDLRLLLGAEPSWRR
jgi:hypothetical protein